MAAAQRHRDAGSLDGTPGCTMCGKHVGQETSWCPLVGSLMCLPCCRSARDFEPDAMVELLSRTDIAMTPTDVMDTCDTCPVALSDVEWESRRSVAEPPEDRPLPS